MVVDCRGIEIEVGDEVVAAGLGSRLHVHTVKALERPGSPDWWVDVRMVGGLVTTPDRCAVVHKPSWELRL